MNNYIMKKLPVCLALYLAGSLCQAADVLPVGSLPGNLSEGLKEDSGKEFSPATFKNISLDNADSYWCVAQSYYKSNRDLDGENGGVQQNFRTYFRLNADGETVTMLNLVSNVNTALYGDKLMVDDEYEVTGVYDPEARTITVKTPYYSHGATDVTVVGTYIYDGYQYGDLVLVSGDLVNTDNGYGLDQKNRLVFDVSEDWKTITPRSVYGCYAAGIYSGFTELYRTATYTIMDQTANLMAIVPEIALMEGATTTVRIPVYNIGLEAVDFTVDCENPSVKLTASGHVDGGGQTYITARVTPDKPGAFRAEFMLKWNGQDFKTFFIEGDVLERPDFNSIVKEGEFTFDTSIDAPFTMAEYNGNPAAVSAQGTDFPSSLIADFEVPHGMVGILHWKGYGSETNPNGVAIYLNGELKGLHRKWGAEGFPEVIDNTLALKGGIYSLEFEHIISPGDDWGEKYGEIQEFFLTELALKLIPETESGAICKNQSIDLGQYYIDTLPLCESSVVEVLNIGNSPLTITRCLGDGIFSAIPRDAEAQFGESVEVTIIARPSEAGIFEGSVGIEAGGTLLPLTCKIETLKLETDFSPIVTEGQFSFTTGLLHPFEMKNGNKAISTLHKMDTFWDGTAETRSWLRASFVVPDGCKAQVSWDGTNSSANSMWFMGTEILLSGSIVSFDGGSPLQFVKDSKINSSMWPNTVVGPGEHNVYFAYLHIADEPDGDDRLTLNSIGYHLTELPEEGLSCTAPSISFGAADSGMHKYTMAYLVNESKNPMQILAIEGTEGFGGVVPSQVVSSIEQLPVLVYCQLDGEGGKNGSITFHTTVGDLTVPAQAEVVAKQGNVIFEESFDIEDNEWSIYDADDDGYTWMEAAAMEPITTFPTEGRDGTRGMGLPSSITTPFETKWISNDDYLTTPYIEMPADGNATLSFWHASFGFNTLEVMAGEDEKVEDLEVVYEYSRGEFDPNPTWTQHEVDLSSLNGKRIRLSFHGMGGGRFLKLDDICVRSTSTDAVDSAVSARVAVAEEWYSVEGQRVPFGTKGVNIVRTRYSDGTCRISKRIAK